MQIIDLTRYKEVAFVKLDKKGNMHEGFIVGYRKGKPVEIHNITHPPGNSVDVILYDETPEDIDRLLREQDTERNDIIISTNGYYTLDAIAHNDNKPRSCPLDLKGAEKIKRNMRKHRRE